mmetsp:Transcript_7610/g.13695  ORF Transcript_7610/g.13695 Transcript_7610/m.13695 type:complete len:245 (-) Transcript_7610:50-784(-)
MENDEIRLADFGLCINVNQECPTSRVGTYEYMAPEVVVASDDPTSQRRGYLGRPAYTTKADVWSVGILLYELLAGSTPFEGGTRAETMGRITGKEPFLPLYVSPEARDFILLTLMKDPRQRPTARKLLAHPLLEKHQLQVKPFKPLSNGWVIPCGLSSADGAGLTVSVTDLKWHTAEVSRLSQLRTTQSHSFLRHVDCFSLPGEVGYHGSVSERVFCAHTDTMRLPTFELPLTLPSGTGSGVVK